MTSSVKQIVTKFINLGHNALPLDTPEVASAKLQHYRDFAVAAERNGVHVPLVSAPLLAGPYPVDTPEVFC